MRTLIFTLLIALAAPAATMAAAPANGPDELMVAWKSICFDTHGDTQKALALATATGWKPMAPLPGAAHPGMSRLEKWVGSDHWELVILDKESPGGDAPFPTRMATCITGLSPSAPDAGPAMRALMGRDAMAVEDGKLTWAYYEHAGQRDFNVELAPEARIAALRAGPFVMVGAIHSPQGSGLSYVMITKADAP